MQYLGFFRSPGAISRFFSFPVVPRRSPNFRSPSFPVVPRRSPSFPVVPLRSPFVPRRSPSSILSNVEVAVLEDSWAEKYDFGAQSLRWVYRLWLKPLDFKPTGNEKS